MVVYNTLMTKETVYLGVDYGHVRIGLSTGSSATRLASPVETLQKVADPAGAIQSVMGRVEATELVVGLPRSLSGEETIQTAAIRAFVDHLTERLGCPVHLQDEAGTSSLAEERLQQSGRPYKKSDIDREAAVIILQDYLEAL